jgi:acyl-CoA synthetase (NDP forming)
MKIDKPREYVVKALRYAFKPESVAVVGASNNPGKVGFQVIQGLRRYRYAGKLFAVNGHEDNVQGLKAYRRLIDIPEPIDLVFIAIGAGKVASVLQEAVEKNVHVVAVATSDFKETGRGELQDELTHFCRDHKLPLLGPNLLGIGNPHFGFNCGFTPFLPEKGAVALISQSGANMLGALGASQLRHFGLSFFAGLGNKADVDFSEFMLYAKEDTNTKCIALYIEGLDSPEAFVDACKSIVGDKPVAVIKVGASRLGAKAAFRHTASENMGTSEAEFDDIFEQAGAIRLETWQEFLDVSMALALQPPLNGDNLVMITNGGGSGLLSCDHFERHGMPMKELVDISAGLDKNLSPHMPAYWSSLNPLDLSGMAAPWQYELAFRYCFEDPNVDGIYGSVCPTAVTDVPAITSVAITTHEKYRHLGKPFVMGLQGGYGCNEAIIELRDHGIPAYPTAEQAVNGILALRKYSRIRERMTSVP